MSAAARAEDPYQGVDPAVGEVTLRAMARDSAAGPVIAWQDGPEGHEPVYLTETWLGAFRVHAPRYAEAVRAQQARDAAEWAARGRVPMDVLGTDDRTLVSSPRSYPHSKHVTMVMQRPHTEVPRRATAYTCSGTFLDEDHVLLAAHCVYNRPDGHWAYANTNVSVQPSLLYTSWGTDRGRGYVCLGGDVDTITEFAERCEFVKYRWIAPDWPDTSGPTIANDYAIVSLERANHANGLGYGRWIAMSDITSEATLESKTAIVKQYPLNGPSGGNRTLSTQPVTDPALSGDLREANWEFHALNQYVHHGGVHADTTTSLLRYAVDTSSASSGAGVFFYVDNATTYTGQAHYLIGVNSASYNSAANQGPTVGQFITWANGILAQ